MSSFRLDPEPLPDDGASRFDGPDGLTGVVLLNNARWFTRIRWIVAAGLGGFGLAGFLLEPDFVRRFGFLPPDLWPLRLAGLLILLNLGFIRWAHLLSMRTTCPWRDVVANLWFQTVADLMVLTVVVCRVGPIETVIGFTYLFHITLACIFFTRRDSLIVTGLSIVLFLATVVLDCMGLLPFPGILVSGADSPSPLSAAIFAVPSVGIWLIVWYLISSISEAVRKRDCELEAANKRISLADEEINLQMLRVTHDLKAPFSGIESNIQVLKHLHWDETPESMRQIIGKIDARSVTLRARISDILMLGNLRSVPANAHRIEPVKLHELLEGVVQDIQGQAEERQVKVALSVCEVTVFSDPKQLKILFSNLISNAILYSHKGGGVEIEMEEDALQAKVIVADHGIGISDSALPHIFDDFYRAQEAATFNPNSTGLGLTIVRQIVRNLRLAIAVESEKDKGTAFQVFLPIEG